MHRLLCLLYILLLTVCTSLHAQPVKLQAVIGAGMSFTTKQGNDNYYVQAIKYMPSLYYRSMLVLQVPISSVVEFETGIGYDRRSIRSVQAYSMNNTDSVINNAKVRHHYLVLPLQVSVLAYKHGQSRIWVSAGFNYGFLLHANTCTANEYFYKGKAINLPQESCFTPSIVLLRDQSRLAGPQPYAQLYAFDVATLLQLTYTFTDRIGIRAHYNYSLYNMEASGDGTTNQHNTGISLLCRLL